MKTVEAYYTIFYGLKRYRRNSKTVNRRRLAQRLCIPRRNISLGITGNFPMWGVKRKTNKFMLFVGRLAMRTIYKKTLG